MKVEVKEIKAKSLEELIMYVLNNLIGDAIENTVESSEEKINITYFIDMIAKKYGKNLDEVIDWISNIKDIYPAAAFNIILREIAVWLDKKYKDHIENSKQIYVISLLDGRIHEVCKKHIKNYRNFAAFRTIEDARYACNVLREVLKEMFSVRK